MKIYQFIIFTTLVIFTLNACSKNTDIHKYKDCITRVPDIIEKSLEKEYCCYLYGVSENEETKRCIPLTESEFNDIEETKKKYEELYGFHVKELTCQ